MDIDESFHDDFIMAFLGNDVPSYGDFTNYLICGNLSKELNSYQQKWFCYDVRRYYWDEPYLFRKCDDHMICHVPKIDIRPIFEACHSFSVGGHYNTMKTNSKIL